MFVYVKSEQNLWTVGFYKPDGGWEPESDHDSEEDAARRVQNLNGNSNYNLPIVFRSTHDLIRSELFLLLQEHRREEISPEEMNAFLESIYKKLNLKLED